MRRLLASLLALVLIAPSPLAAERFRAISAPKAAPGVVIPLLGPAISLTTSMTPAGPSIFKAEPLGLQAARNIAVAPAAQPTPRGATAQNIFALAPKLEKSPELELNSAFDHASRPSSSQEAVLVSDLPSQSVPQAPTSRLQRLRRTTVAAASTLLMTVPLTASAFIEGLGGGGYNPGYPMYQAPKIEPAASSGLGLQIALLVIGVAASIAISIYAMRQYRKSRALSAERLMGGTFQKRGRRNLDDYREMQDPPHVQDALRNRGQLPDGTQPLVPAAPPVKKIKFADVAGQEEAKAELAQVVGFLKDPTIYRELGAMPELARVNLALGRSQMMLGRRLDAIQVLEEALSEFTRAGNTPLAEEARALLNRLR